MMAENKPLQSQLTPLNNGGQIKILKRIYDRYNNTPRTRRKVDDMAFAAQDVFNELLEEYSDQRIKNYQKWLWLCRLDDDATGYTEGMLLNEFKEFEKDEQKYGQRKRTI